MEEVVRHLPNKQILDIFAKRVLAKKTLTKYQIVFQENYTGGTPTGEKVPLKLFILNRLDPNNEPIPVKCLKLCKRVIAEGYPQNSIICNSKSKVTLRFQLILLVEYEDNSFDIITLPNNLSHRFQYDPNITKAIVQGTVIDSNGVPILQRQSTTVPYETLIINSNGVNDYPSFTYSVTIPFSEFDNALKKCELQDPTLQSYILLKNLSYDIDVIDVVNVEATNIVTSQAVTLSTSEVDFSLFEDIIDKLGIDQDVIIEGIPEAECED